VDVLKSKGNDGSRAELISSSLDGDRAAKEDISIRESRETLEIQSHY
jgi:hypothetical protein